MSAAVQSASPSQFSPPPRMGDLDGPAASPEDEEAASLELAMRLQLEEEAWMAQQQAGMAQQQAMEETADEDEESLALAIRLQQEDDDSNSEGSEEEMTDDEDEEFDENDAGEFDDEF